MSYKEQVEFRLKILNNMIDSYLTMSHPIGISQTDIENIFSALITWRDETELLLHEYE